MYTQPLLVLPTPELVDKLITAERNCMVNWLQAMAMLPGNPLGVVIENFGHATTLLCPHIPAQVFNRVIGMTVDDRVHIPAILTLYAQHGATPMFDLNPYATPPFWITPNIPLVLVEHGFYHGASHQILYGAPTPNIPELPAHLTIQDVTLDNIDAFVHIYEQVWGDGTAIRVLVGHPQFRCYLALVEDVPAALGVLHVANGIGSMANALTVPAFRGRGCQTALLYRRIRDAVQAGCNLLVSQCMPGVTSQNNQVRVGFQIAGSKAWWVPVPSGS